MAYQVIARKWRPQTFTDVVGQSHITQTLSNALKNGRIHHALLFTGPRGTGKTSSARIMAKSLRCPNAVDFKPCGVCPSCLEITAGRSLDVQELDAASNNSVDDIRKLLEGVMSSPSSGRWKIYIIDEVHMLSGSAFNALLKTLEEPPSHVVFILATTEVQKIPETILSRCLRFDFRRIPTRQIVEHLKQITTSENVKADDEALWQIARQGDGSMRDSLSLLDQVITFANEPLSRELVTRILGLTDREMLGDALKALAERDRQRAMKVVERLNIAGIEPKLFAQELLETLRNLLIVKVSGSEMSSILDLPDSELTMLADTAAHMSEEDIHLLFDMTLKGAQDIPRAQDPRIVLEILLLRMAASPRIVDLQTLLGQNPQPRGDLQSPSSFLTPVKPDPIPVGAAALSGPRPLRAPAAPPAKAVVEAPVAEVAPAPKAPPQIAKGDTIEDRWLDFVNIIRKDDPLFAAKIESLNFSGAEGRVIKLAIPPKLTFLKDMMADGDVRKKLKGFIDSHWGDGYSFEVVSGRDLPAGPTAQTLAAKKSKEAEEDMRMKIESHPVVLAAQKVFQGNIKTITPVKEGVQK